MAKQKTIDDYKEKGKIDASFGFSDEEINKLEEYLKEYSADIMHKAREITGITHWLK